jgi:hypothetical protein
MKVARQSSMRIHVVAGDSAIYFHIINAPSLLLSAFMKKMLQHVDIANVES